MRRPSEGLGLILASITFCNKGGPVRVTGVFSVCTDVTLRALWRYCVNCVPDKQVLSTYQYVIELRKRLEQTCILAHENLKKVQ